MLPGHNLVTDRSSRTFHLIVLFVAQGNATLPMWGVGARYHLEVSRRRSNTWASSGFTKSVAGLSTQSRDTQLARSGANAHMCALRLSEHALPALIYNQDKVEAHSNLNTSERALVRERTRGASCHLFFDCARASTSQPVGTRLPSAIAKSLRMQRVGQLLGTVYLFISTDPHALGAPCLRPKFSSPRSTSIEYVAD